MVVELLWPAGQLSPEARTHGRAGLYRVLALESLPPWGDKLVPQIALIAVLINLSRETISIFSYLWQFNVFAILFKFVGKLSKMSRLLLK